MPKRWLWLPSHGSGVLLSLGRVVLELEPCGWGLRWRDPRTGRVLAVSVATAA